MAKTLSTIRTNVRSLLDEAVQADWTDTQIDVFINERYHEVYTAVIGTFENYYSTTTTFDTVANQEEYTTSDGFPTDLYKLRRVEINYDTSIANTAASRALPIDIDAVRRDLAQANLGVFIHRNPVYYLQGNTIGFIPIPDKSQSDAIKLWYVKYLTELSSDSDTIDIPYPDRYWKLIAYGAVSDLLGFGQQDMSSSNQYQRMFEQMLDKMQQELEDRVSEESKGITDVLGETYDFTGAQY